MQSDWKLKSLDMYVKGEPRGATLLKVTYDPETKEMFIGLGVNFAVGTLSDREVEDFLGNIRFTINTAREKLRAQAETSH